MTHYKSTRGGVSGLGFEEAVFMGLAPDRGLLVPEIVPLKSLQDISKWRVCVFLFFVYFDLL